MRTSIIALLLPILLISAAFAHTAKKESPESVTGATTVSTAAAKQLFDQGAVFIDVRSQQDWEAGRRIGRYPGILLSAGLP